jgi:ubiquinone biosynthesis monooxygenase Coq7
MIDSGLLQAFPSYGELPISADLRQELRSDHAGETGAVEIYRGILAVSRDPAVRAFAREHLATEVRHRDFFDEWLPIEARTRLKPVWRLAGWLLGASAALFGARGVFRTIEAVETFVDDHYAAQIDAMAGQDELAPLSTILESFREDEVEHRDDAARRGRATRSWPARCWFGLVEGGSRFGVLLARRL